MTAQFEAVIGKLGGYSQTSCFSFKVSSNIYIRLSRGPFLDIMINVNYND